MIKKIRIRNFKCYGPRSADFNLAKVNFIFGDNSAGKSTFLQFLKKIEEICGFDGRCDRSDLDKHLFKHQPGDIFAKIRVVNEENGAESVWDFRVAANNPQEYELIDTEGNRISRETLSAILPAGGGESIMHIEANRKSEESVKSGTAFQKAFSTRADLEASEEAREYLNDVMERLGIPYTCIVDETNHKISSSSIHDRDFDIDLPLSDVGTGIDGLVHLALTLNNWKGGVLAIEEPETNVNEEQMAALATVLVEETLKRKTGQLIVECHSKLMALQLIDLVRRGTLTCDGDHPNLSVMVVEKLSQGARVENAIIERHGDIVAWPSKGFFPAEGNLIRRSYRRL